MCLGQETVVIKLSHCRCRRTHPDRLGTMLKLEMIQFHPQVHISYIDINAIQPSLARRGKKDTEIDSMSKTNDNDSVLE